MNTPICDFVENYIKQNGLRLHMPGHKGHELLGMEQKDITEIRGADSLYEADGIIRQSECNAGSLFEADTYYSAEGSSQCIRAMLLLALWYAADTGRNRVIAAGRNVHQTFLSAAAMLDFDVLWMQKNDQTSYLSCALTAKEVEEYLAGTELLPAAVYLTSPDYLGAMLPLEQIAEVCKQHGVLLLVDNAHGAYLKFLDGRRHPMELGADLCCDSAHKTLPALTGTAYLHISWNAPGLLHEQAKTALSFFGSTSPSYLLLQSLDAVNAYLSAGYREKLRCFCRRLEQGKERLRACGYELYGEEPLKITVKAKSYGYEGQELAQLLREKHIECEFADSDFLVLMLTPETGEEGLKQLLQALCSIPVRNRISERPPAFMKKKRVLSIREAFFSRSEEIPVEQGNGRVLAGAAVSCPPAVPVVVCGEQIDAAAIACFQYYGVEKIRVVGVKDEHVSEQENLS